MHEMKEQSSANELQVTAFIHITGNTYTKLILCMHRLQGRRGNLGNINNDRKCKQGMFLGGLRGQSPPY